MPTPIPTPSAAEISQLTRDASQLLTIWNSLGPVMAVILLCAIALFAVLWSQRDYSKGNSAVLKMLADNNAQKDKDIIDLKAQRDQENLQHREIMLAVNEQMKRSNDIGQTANETLLMVNDRGLERDNVQKQLSEDIHAIISTGSLPVQEILSRVRDMAEMLTRVDTRTADWNEIVKTITPLIVELGVLRTEAKKHSTQPIPTIDPPPANGTEAAP